ncbi:unnamed protein product, partial [Prorocentrum cordatum]
DEDEPVKAKAKPARPKPEVEDTVIGIDLGTTFSCVAVMKKSGVEIIPNDQGNRITPSYVSFTEGGKLIGEAAKNEASVRPTQTMFDIKRLIGRRYSDETVKGTGVGQKLRLPGGLNVLALEGEAEAGKFLVCVDGGAGVGDLAAKIHGALQKNCIGGHPVRLLNGHRAELPSDECAADILRDGEGVIAILSKDPLNRPPWSANRLEEGVDNTEQTDEVEKPEGRPPGPGETFEEDVQVRKPLELQGPPGDCWELANLTPKLREFISMRFCEVASCNAQLENHSRTSLW